MALGRSPRRAVSGGSVAESVRHQASPSTRETVSSSSHLHAVSLSLARTAYRSFRSASRATIAPVAVSPRVAHSSPHPAEVAAHLSWLDRAVSAITCPCSLRETFAKRGRRGQGNNAHRNGGRYKSVQLSIRASAARWGHWQASEG